MPTWTSYSLADLLMFSPATYLRLFELHNAAVWPLQLFTVAWLLLIVLLMRRTPGGGQRLGLTLLAVPWAFVAWVFLHQRYAQINLAADAFAVAFALQASLLAMAAAVRWRPAATAAPGLALVGYALLVHPLLGVLAGRSWRASEWFGIAPDPTALATLGILLLGSGKVVVLLALIPVLWCLVSGLTFLAMDVGHGLATPAAALLAVTARIVLGAAGPFAPFARRKEGGARR